MKWQKHVSTCSLEALEKECMKGCISAEVADISSATEHHPSMLKLQNCHHQHEAHFGEGCDKCQQEMIIASALYYSAFSHHRSKKKQMERRQRMAVSGRGWQRMAVSKDACSFIKRYISESHICVLNPGVTSLRYFHGTPFSIC